MSRYIPIAEHAIKNSSNELIRYKLCEAQKEIKRLERDIIGEVEWRERVRELEERYNALERDLDTASRAFRATGERLSKLEVPPKDLSDPYPLDGPNVREQNRYDSVAKRLEALERSIVAVGGVSTLEARLTALSETVARNKKGAGVQLEAEAGRIFTLERQMASLRSGLNKLGKA